MLKTDLQSQLNTIITKNFPNVDQVEANLQFPTKPGFGDLTSTIALSLGKKLKQNPQDIARAIDKSLSQSKSDQIIQKVEIAGPGFLNLTLTDQAIWDEFLAITSTINLPKSDLAGQNVMVEFSSPNIAKPFNVGHLRSTIIGDCLARLNRYLGANVLTDNHLGDWGTQYGKLAYAVEQWGDWAKISTNPIPELFQLYVKFHQQEKDDPTLTEKGRDYFRRLEQGDPSTKAVWQKLVDLSLQDFHQLYQQLDVHFDYQFGESFYEDKMSEVIKECQEAGLAQRSEGALLIFYPNDELPPLMIEKSNGTSTYGTRDLAALKYRIRQFHLDKLIIEIGNEQKLYFQQVIRAAELLGWTKPGQVIHIGHGLFLLPTGKMSTRRGETVWLKDLIDELTQKSLDITRQKSPQLSQEQHQQISHQIAIGALKYNDLAQNRNSNVVFDKDKSLSLDGNSAPYLQYTIARARSVLRLAEPLDLNSHSQTKLIIPSLPLTERQLALQIMKWPDTIQEAASTSLPSTLTTYLFQLAQQFNQFYHTEPILQATETDRHRRLVLTNGIAHTLITGLQLLGIAVPERM